MPQKKPPKPYATFPLFAHSKGYWCKKIDKRQESFGSWEWPDRKAYEHSWRAALAAYQKFEADRAAGRYPRARSDRLTLETLVNAFLTHKHDQAAARAISSRMFYEYRICLLAFRDEVGGEVRVSDLEGWPEQIQMYLAAVDKEYGWHAYNKRMALIRAMFKWAADPLGGDLLQRPFRLVGLFVKRSDKLRRREKRLRDAAQGKAITAPAELRAMLEHAPLPLRAMILLGIFAAYGNTDCADLPISAINVAPDKSLGLPEGWAIIHFPRPKTEVDRAAVVPPIVVDGLQEALARRPAVSPLQPDAAPIWEPLVFLTAQGFPFVRELVHRDEADQVANVVHMDEIATHYRRLRRRIYTCPQNHSYEFRPGDCRCLACRQPLAPLRPMGFYALRHTAITWASGAADIDVLSRWQGHSLPGMRRIYVEDVEAHRMKAIADRLLERLGWATRSTLTPPAAAAPPAQTA